MSRAPSALVAIGGFGVAVATLSVATTAAIVILAPPPPALRTSPAEAVAALRGEMPGFDRRLADMPPKGVRATMIEGLIAAELRRSPADVRVTWPEGTFRGDVRLRIRGAGMAVRRGTGDTRPPAFVLVERQKGRFEMLAPGAASSAIRTSLLGLPMPAFAASVRQRDGRWLTIEAVRPFLGGWHRNILIALAVSLLLLVPLAWIFARRLTRPFRALAGALGGTADAIPEEGPRELREAAAAITAMRTRLATEAAERARMLTAIAHDLRTPLTGLRLRIEAAPEPQRARMVADVERMQAMIVEVLAFARDAASPSELLDVRTLLTQIAVDMTAGGAAIRLMPGDEAWVSVPEPAFRRAIENLLRNAIDYAGGGTVEVERVYSCVVVSVADTGPGIPPADRERLLRPFERGEASRNRDTGGAGLGLSIVRDFAAQHRGDFALADAPGGGTIATLRLPAT